MRFFELHQNDSILNIDHSIVSPFDTYCFDDGSFVCFTNFSDFDSVDGQLFLTDRINNAWNYSLSQSQVDSLTDEDLKKQDLINIDFNSIKRVYPDGTVKICVSDRPFNVGGRNEYPAFEGFRDIFYRRRKVSQRDRSSESKSDKSIDRARQKIFDICMLNAWEWFVTLTFDELLIDRTSQSSTSSRVSQWINDHLVKKFDNVRYIVVPEQHKKYEKNGVRAYHYHMLLSGVPDSEFVDSGTCLVKGFKKAMKYETFKRFQVLGKAKQSDFQCPVFNVPSFRSGFTVAIRVYRNGIALAGYMTKYIVKDLDKTDLPFGKAVYKCSRGNLRHEPDIYYGYFDVSKVPKSAFSVSKEFASFYFWDNIEEIKTKDQVEFFVFGLHPRLIAGFKCSTPSKG